VESLLPFQPYGVETLSVDQAIWTPLWYGDPTGTMHPGLVQEVPSLQNGGVSADEKTWTIRLRPNLKWSDGSPLTAADVVFSLNTYADVHFTNIFGFPRHDPSDPIDFLGATALDSTTVQFTLAHPSIAMLTYLADGATSPIPREVFGAVPPEDFLTSHQGIFPTVVSGPFKMKEHVRGDHLTVVRNPYYYQGPAKPYLDQITFRFLADEDALLTALQAGQVDTAYSFLSPTNLGRYRALTGYTTYLDQYPAGYEELAFNLATPVLKHLAVRQALTLSLDPRQVIAQAVGETAAPTCDDQAGTYAHEQQLTCYPQDALRAGQLLDQDGWRLGPDGFRHKGGQTLTLRYRTSTSGHPERPRIEAVAQAAWERVGVKITFQNYPFHKFFQDILPGRAFDIAEFANVIGYDPDDHWFFMCDKTPDVGSSNFMHYCNPVVDQAEMLQQSTTDRDVRRAAFRTIHAAILADVPLMYLYSLRQIGIYRSTLHNYSPSVVGASEMWNVWDWYLA
jgi:peptide/nickel transport system substrate-binding protein